MSKPREANPELARILSRVNALMKHELESPVMQEPSMQEAPVQEPPEESPVQEQAKQASETAVPEPEVPVLTDVYEGEPAILAPRTIDDFAAFTVDPSAEERDDAALEAIVAELMPLIRTAVKKAVRKELINMEKIVNHRLETEFIQTLMQRLRSDRQD